MVSGAVTTFFGRTEENQSNFSQDGNKPSDSIRGGKFILLHEQ
jgi:hypothetical protein